MPLIRNYVCDVLSSFSLAHWWSCRGFLMKSGAISELYGCGECVMIRDQGVVASLDHSWRELDRCHQGCHFFREKWVPWCDRVGEVFLSCFHCYNYTVFGIIFRNLCKDVHTQVLGRCLLKSTQDTVVATAHNLWPASVGLLWLWSM